MADTASLCLLCDMEEVDDSVVVFRDELWAAEVVPGYDVPGWFILRVRRHAERITGLGDEELATFAVRARDLVAAVAEVTGAPTTYLLVFGENYPHFHVLVASRGDNVPPDRRADRILSLRLDGADPQAAATLVPAVRRAYDERSRRSPTSVPAR